MAEMTSKEIVTYLSENRGARLCMEHTEEGRVYWLSPRRIIVRADQAEKIIPLLKDSGDALPFKDAVSQTWRA
jgi:hypothetical protein